MKTIIVLIVVIIIAFIGIKSIFNMITGKDKSCDCSKSDDCNIKNCHLK